MCDSGQRGRGGGRGAGRRVRLLEILCVDKILLALNHHPMLLIPSFFLQAGATCASPEARGSLMAPSGGIWGRTALAGKPNVLTPLGMFAAWQDRVTQFPQRGS